MNEKPSKLLPVILGLVLVLIGAKWYTLNNGSETIGSMFEKERYSTRQVIQLSSQSGQKYSTEADLEACYIDETQFDGSGCVNSCPKRVYLLKSAKLPDGKVVQFCDQAGQPNGCCLDPTQKVTAPDTNGEQWQVELVAAK